ncbi:unnamed protein product [marine sediment metagenome]|uniref:Uncharacterized protein n=1 Tax=marine sediment metagenome TaxID=412755 RepID=X0UBG7_9ZZZZ
MIEKEVVVVERVRVDNDVVAEITKAIRDRFGPMVHPGRVAMVTETVNTKNLELCGHIVPPNSTSAQEEMQVDRVAGASDTSRRSYG